MARFRLLLALLTIVVATAPLTSQAHGGGACFGAVSESGSCHFYLRGAPTTITAEATVPSGMARVRIWVTIGEDPTHPTATILECAATGEGRASCSATLGDTGHMLDSTKWLVLATCHIEGVGAGTYGCKSALGF